MTFQLDLPVDLQERLRFEAGRRGEPAEAVALRVLDAHLPPPPGTRRAAAIATLDRWREEDAAATEADSRRAEDFFHGLDAARTSNRPLFPPELEGISW